MTFTCVFPARGMKDGGVKVGKEIYTGYHQDGWLLTKFFFQRVYEPITRGFFLGGAQILVYEL